MRALLMTALFALLASGCAEPVPEGEEAGPATQGGRVKVQEERLWRGEAEGSTARPFEVGLQVPEGSVRLWVHQGPLTGAASGMTIASPCATWGESSHQVSVSGGGRSWMCEDPPAGAGTVRVSAEGAWKMGLTVVAEVVSA